MLGGLEGKLLSLGFALIIAGVVLSIIAIALTMLKAPGKTEGGAVVIIGPIPIVLSSSPTMAKYLMILAIILTIVVLLIFILPWLMFRHPPTRLG
ncbi:MAG: DUF131 domain-containing protein [Pyrodictiaceae archaeon]